MGGGGGGGGGGRGRMENVSVLFPTYCLLCSVSNASTLHFIFTFSVFLVTLS